MFGSCKINIFFKSEENLLNMFHFQDCLHYDLVYNFVYKLECGRCSFAIAVELLGTYMQGLEKTEMFPQ